VTAAYNRLVPSGPLPDPLAAWFDAPHPAVVATLRGDGSPSTAATWYDVVESRVRLSMQNGGARHRNLTRDPRLSLTALDDDWYRQVTVIARVVELRRDADLTEMDELSQRYLGEPYSDRDYDGITAIAEVEGWHSFGFDV
jgi:PPOX class probable F420-dependent enzyme